MSISKSDVNRYPVGTAEYVVLHGIWQLSRGRKPSACFWGSKNPIKAFSIAQRIAYFPKTGVYLDGKVPENYICGECGASGVKLWREYQVFLAHQSFRCMTCSCREQDKVRTPTEDGYSLYTDEVHYLYRTATMEPGWWTGYDPKKGPPADATETKTHREKTDQIGWRIPAVPTEDGSYWGYTSVPTLGVEWWRKLPVFPAEKTN